MAAKDDDDDDDDGDSSGPGSGDDDDHSGHGGGGDDDDDNSGPGGGGDDDDDVTITGEIPDGTTEIRIVDDDPDGFSPGEVTVDLGATVTFVNAHDDPHTATGPDFDTGILQPGATATIELIEPGTYRYACQIHPEMTGTILVRDEDGNVPGATPAATPGASPVAGDEAETVEIRDFAFDPPELRVGVGTTVVWENGDTVPHTATAEEESFDTDTIEPGASASVTFDEAGTFAYVCAFHPNMQGTIVVE